LYGSATIGRDAVSSVTGSSSSTQSPMYSMPAAARWSNVSIVCARPGPHHPRGRYPAARAMRSIALSMASR